MRLIPAFALIFFTGCHAHHPLRSLEHELKTHELKTFKRTSGQERWELQDDPNWDRDRILKSLTELGLKDATFPQKRFYTSAVMLGATAPKMQERVNYLIRIWNEGTRFEKVVFLTGDRDFGEIDQPFSRADGSNETQLLRHIWAHTPKPVGLDSLPELWVDAPKIRHADGLLGRPTTVSTIEAWKKMENLAGEDLLAFSNQPTVDYQECALMNYLPKGVKVETIGPKANADLPIAIYLDALAGSLTHCPPGSPFQQRIGSGSDLQLGHFGSEF
ncbi:MAG: hypothetical protein V4534_04240 [Myxococcota bacterium]